MNDLSLIPTDELMDEVLSRFDHAAFVGAVDRTDENHFVYRRWAGNAHGVVGLCSDLSTIVLQDYHSDNCYDWETDDDD